MYNICFFCGETVGSGDPVWILEKEKPKRVLRCPQCHNHKESVIARIIGELKKMDFSVRENENNFGQGLRICYEIVLKITEWRNLVDREGI